MAQSNTSARRRGLGRALLIIGLFATTLGYVGLLVRSLVIDTSTTVEAATAALHDGEVHSLLSERTVDAVISQLVGETAERDLAPFGIDVRKDLAPVAESLVATPEFERAFADAVAQLHQRIFLDPTVTPAIDVSALVSRARIEAAAVNPAYAQVIPPAATLVVTIPADELPDLTALDRQVGSGRALATLVLGLVLTAAATAVAAERWRTARSIGRYCLTLAGVQLLLCIVVSFTLDRVSGDAARIMRASADVVLAHLALPALAPLVVGGVAIAVSMRQRRAAGGRVLADGRAAFLNDEHGRPTEWTFDTAFEPEVLRTAPSVASYQR